MKNRLNQERIDEKRYTDHERYNRKGRTDQDDIEREARIKAICARVEREQGDEKWQKEE